MKYDGRKVIEDAGVTVDRIVRDKPPKKERNLVAEVPTLNADQVGDVVDAYRSKEAITTGWPKWAKSRSMDKDQVIAVVKAIRQIDSEEDAPVEAESRGRV